MPSYRLRTIDARPGTTLTRGDNSTWLSEQTFDTPKEAGEYRMGLERPFSVRVLRDVDGEPEPLDFNELREVNGVQARFQRQEYEAQRKAKERPAA